jgi:hypothetical protein
VERRLSLRGEMATETLEIRERLGFKVGSDLRARAWCNFLGASTIWKHLQLAPWAVLRLVQSMRVIGLFCKVEARTDKYVPEAKEEKNSERCGKRKNQREI